MGIRTRRGLQLERGEDVCRLTHAACGCRGAESSEQSEVAAAAAQRKKRNKGGRKRAAAVRADSEEQQQQQQHSSGASPTDWPSEAQGAPAIPSDTWAQKCLPSLQEHRSHW